MLVCSVVKIGAMKAYERIEQALLEKRTVLLDGGIGSELVRRGVRWRDHGLRSDADKVLALHCEYIAAGADVIRTNTFQLNRRLYLNVFHDLEHMRRIGAEGLETRARELLKKAARLALEARERAAGRSVAVAGSIAPINHCFRPDLSPPYDEALAEHRENAAALAEAGVDLLLLESMNNITEAKAALAAARETGLPVWISFVIGPELNLLGGETIRAAVEQLAPLGPRAILLNCAPASDLSAALGELARTSKLPFGAYAHIGRFDPPSWKFEFFPQFVDTEECPPEKYLEHAERWREIGATIIGGCCGTGPEHVQALARRFKG